jgi:hypothetical protein
MIKILRETHDAPASVARRLEIAGGRNRFGQPNYRAVWGWSRLGWIGGKWTDRDAEGTFIRETMCLRQVPKYTPHDRWHIERWVAPEMYGSPREWYAQTMEREGNGAGGVAIPALGPYPTHGEYEHCFTLQGPAGEFVQLTPTVAEYVARAIEAGRHIDAARRRAAIDAREEKSERDYDAWSWEVLSSGDRAFNAQPFVAVP